MRIIGLALLPTLSLLFAISCSGNGPSIIDDSKFYIIVSIEPIQNNVASGPTNYSAYAQIEDTSLSDLGDASSAVVMVNGQQLPLYSTYKDYFRKSNIGSLATGDSVTVTIDYEKIDRISETLIVPPSLASFTLNPGLTAGTPNPSTQHSYQLGWSAGAAGIDEYLPAYEAYSLDSSAAWVKGSGVFTTGLSFTFGAPSLDGSGGSACPYLRFFLSSVAKHPLGGYSAGSAIRLMAVDRLMQANTSF